MNCTVLGASGFVGARLAECLRAAGHAVWAPLRNDPELWERPLGHAFYCIGLTGDFRRKPFETMEAHVSLLARVLQHARFESLLYLSSTRVYLGSERTDEDAPLRVQPANPSDLYNLSKLAGEALCHATGNPRVRVARLSNVVGPGMDPASGNFVASLLDEAQRGELLLQSSPDSEKDYIHVDDVACWLPMIAAGGHHRVYNVASGLQRSHAQWASWVAERTGCAWRVAAEASLQRHAPIDVRRLQGEFGVTPRPVDDWSPSPLSR